MSRTLGISFSSDKIRFTELSFDTFKPKLEHFETVSVDFNFDADLSQFKSNQKILTNISNELKNFVSRRKTAYDKVSVTIGTSQAFMIILPVDFSEGKQSINSKIYWELSNYFPDNYSEFIINTYRLNSFLPCSKSDEFMIIAVPKNTIEFITRVFKLANMELSLVDIDQFASEQALRKGYAEELEKHNSLLIGLKNGRIDYGYIANKKFRFYTYSRYQTEPQFNLSLVRKIGLLQKSNYTKEGIDKIFLYGEDVREDTLEALRKIPDVEIEVLNPFESLTASSEFLKNEDLRKFAHQYSASTGIALRSLSAN